MGKLAFILGVPVAMLATVASLGVVVVDVREGGPDGHHIVVPVPLVLAQAALAVAPAFAPRGQRCGSRPARRSSTSGSRARCSRPSARRRTASSSGSRRRTSRS